LRYVKNVSGSLVAPVATLETRKRRGTYKKERLYLRMYTVSHTQSDSRQTISDYIRYW